MILSPVLDGCLLSVAYSFQLNPFLFTETQRIWLVCVLGLLLIGLMLNQIQGLSGVFPKQSLCKERSGNAVPMYNMNRIDL